MTNYLSKLTLIIALKTIFLFVVILYSQIGLGPDEAQYWTWSQKLDWGYYSKPPGIAWQIFLGTKIFGNTELGVRFMSIVMGICLSYGTYYLAKVCRATNQTAFWSALVLTLSPLGFLGSLLAITDGGLALFWLLATIVTAIAIRDLKTPNYYLLGAVLALGALFKWPIYLFWVAIVVLAYFYRFLIKPSFFLGVVISLLGLLPSVIWNVNHEWGTFRHVFTTIKGGTAKEIGTTPLPKGNFFDFIGSQAALISPLIFILLIASFVYLLRKRNKLPPALFFCGFSSLLFFLIYISLSIFQKIQGNWVSYIYSASIVFLCWYACEKLVYGVRLLKIGVSLSLIMVLIGFAIPEVQSHNVLSSLPIPYKLNPFRQNMGWKNLKSEIEKIRYDPNENFLFGDKYQMSSILSFYSPGQNQAYFLNLQKMRHNQFSYWPSMKDEQLGKTGYFVYSENNPNFEKELDDKVKSYQSQLKNYFKEVELVGETPIFSSYGKLSKGALIFKCVDYNGKEPSPSDTY